MKVSVHPADMWGCGHYRLIWPAQALAAQGHDVTVHLPVAGFPLRVKVDAAGRPIDAALPGDSDCADVVVMQRPTHRLMVDLIADMRRAGRTVVVDMDDDLSCVHPRNVAAPRFDPKRSPHNNWKLAEQACRLASLVTVSTPELQRRYGLRRSRVLRNCVPAAFLDVQPPIDIEPCWGWAGALGSHPDDLPILGPAVAQLGRRGHQFRIVGRPDGTGRALGLTADPPATGGVPFELWPHAVATLTVGAAPLADSRFNRAKSWLKPLEYAACGVPWVSSDLAEYGELHRFGAGAVATRTRDWVGAVHALLRDPGLRAEQAAAGRAVAAEFTIEGHAWRWMETWSAAWALDRGRGAVTVLTR